MAAFHLIIYGRFWVITEVQKYTIDVRNVGVVNIYLRSVNISSKIRLQR